MVRGFETSLQILLHLGKQKADEMARIKKRPSNHCINCFRENCICSTEYCIRCYRKDCICGLECCIKCRIYKDKQGRCYCTFKHLQAKDGKDDTVENSDDVGQSKYLMDLPDDMLIRILGHVAPRCGDCFEQRAILTLGRVSKRMHELSKRPELYKRLRFRQNCRCRSSAFPPTPVFRAIVDRSTMLRRLEVELTDKGQEEMVYYALEKRGSVLGEVTVDLDKNHDKFLTSRKQDKAILMVDVMQGISELSPTALTSLQFVTNYWRNFGPSDFTFTLSEDGGHNLPLSSRILGLSVGSGSRTTLYHAEMGGWETVPRFVAYGISCSRSIPWSCLEVVTVENLELLNDVAPEDLVAEYKVWLGKYNPRLLGLYNVSYMIKEKVINWQEVLEEPELIDIVIEKISHNDKFGDPDDEMGNPERAFRKFLSKIRKVELEQMDDYSEGESDDNESDRKLEEIIPEQLELTDLNEMRGYRRFIGEIYYLFSHHIPSYTFLLPSSITYEESDKLQVSNMSFKQLLCQRFSQLRRTFKKSPGKVNKKAKQSEQGPDEKVDMKQENLECCSRFSCKRKLRAKISSLRRKL